MRAKLLLPILLCLLVTACAGSTTMRIRPDAAETAETSETPLSFAVRLEERGGDACGEDGTVLARWGYQIPVMSALRADGTEIGGANARTERERQAIASSAAFNGEFERWMREADFGELEVLAKEDYQWRKGSDLGWEEPYVQELSCTLYQTERLVSVSGRFYYYGGGAHPNTVLLGWNFDPRTGAFLSPDRLFEDTEPVAEELIQQADDRAADYHMAPEQCFWEDYQSILNLWSESPAAVTFDETAMTVAYSPYDLACYAAGEQIFTIPRPALTPWLSAYGRDLLNVPEPLQETS